MAAILNNSKEDIIYFKDEVLKDVKQFEIKIGQKYDSQALIVKTKLEQYETKMTAMIEKINVLANKISTNISLKEKVEEIYEFKIKALQDQMIQEVKIETTANELKDAINKYDSILLESVIYSGVIGKNCKFQTFHNLIDYILNTLNQLNLAKDKSNIDFKNMKKKYDSAIQSLKSQADSNTKGIKDVSKRMNDTIEEKFKNFEEDNNKKLIDLRMNNNKYAIELKEKADMLAESYKNMEQLKKEVEETVKKEINRIINIPKETNKKLEHFREEIEKIKTQLYKLSDFVKNKKFETIIIKQDKEKEKENEKVDESKDEDKKPISKKNLNINKGPMKIAKSPEVSLLKQYINGEITFEKYNEKRKIHKNEETKIGENNQNKLNNKEEPMKKIYTMNLANEAGIYVIDKNKNIDFGLSNPIKQKFKVNYNNYNNIHKISNSQEKELNNNDEDIAKMIKIYNLNHIKYKSSVEKVNKASNTTFQENENLSDKIVDDVVEKEFSYIRNNSASANSSPKRTVKYNDDDKNKFSEKIYLNKSFYLEGKKYFPEIIFFGTGLIEVINYNTKSIQPPKESKKEDLLEFIKKSYDEQENVDEKKLFQLKNAINFSKNIKNNNYGNNNDIFPSNLINPLKKRIIKNIYNKEKNINKSKNSDSQSISNALERRSDTNLFPLEKINFEKTASKMEINNLKYLYKKLNPVKLKGNNSTTNIRKEKSKGSDFFFNEKKQIGNLVNRIKDMIPYEEKISLFETSNLENLNKNVFSKRGVYLGGKEEKDENKTKDLVMKKLYSVYQNEPKSIKNNKKINLINNENI